MGEDNDGVGVLLVCCSCSSDGGSLEGVLRRGGGGLGFLGGGRDGVAYGLRTGRQN